MEAGVIMYVQMFVLFWPMIRFQNYSKLLFGDKFHEKRKIIVLYGLQGYVSEITAYFLFGDKFRDINEKFGDYI